MPLIHKWFSNILVVDNPRNIRHFRKIRLIKICGISNDFHDYFLNIFSCSFVWLSLYLWEFSFVSNVARDFLSSLFSFLRAFEIQKLRLWTFSFTLWYALFLLFFTIHFHFLFCYRTCLWMQHSVVTNINAVWIDLTLNDVGEKIPKLSWQLFSFIVSILGTHLIIETSKVVCICLFGI